MVELKPVEGDVYLWKYLPSIPAAALFLVLFAVATGVLCWRLIRTRTWFCIPFAIGGILQVGGYGVRIYCHWHTDEIPAFAVQSSFIILAPVFYAASIYMVLRRLICSIKGERFSIVPAKWLTWIFVAGDVIALSIQGNAVGLTFKESTQKIGEWIITAGLIVQILIFGFFIIVCSIFHARMNKDVSENPRSGPHLTIPWRAGLKMLYACSALIMVRSVFRVIEYVMGVDAYLLANEWPWYIFDAVLMLATQVIFVVWFPDQFRPEEIVLKSEGDSEDGHTLVEVERRGFDNC
ncbi:hypothetical protein AOL_s00097g323 [Orbilia oligospora ATCC 24927]|uniref:Uncharacterized protein n=2 Tax=Orbilia oligospora TaxID=2813651 RepID=G1XIZ6_ARTOA|nr:hypothetical protein AOL_s00097g323 [Orbilia oligospora ATCC 24927]EGX46897.1 hypothetical protein AOL_s00097g323 [Orbilia oligospora ATCC 24927]KAF3283706.1 hypothetical protein TWF970_000882 [Orbilia oligospora]